MVKTATPGRWRLQQDDGSIIERPTGAANGDADGEYWRLTDRAGVQYFFGRNTTSAWTVPVFGPDPGDACHSGITGTPDQIFAASKCVQAWRWNLDYVVDPHGNGEKFAYTPEYNYYRLNNNGPVRYTRGGQLTDITYGLVAGSTATPPMRVHFDLVGRCVSAPTCDSAHPANWPDTPWDENCPVSDSCTDQTTPTFWSIYMISTIHAQLLVSAVYTDVDILGVAHSFPAPGDGTAPALWVPRMLHIAYAGAASLVMPYTFFTGAAMQNRVWVKDGLAPLDKWRITTVTAEAGAVTSVTYSAQQCTPTSLPASPQTNTMRCFPQWWTPQVTPAQPAQLDYFHKYVVTMTGDLPVVGGTDHTATVQTSYDYTGTPGWRYDLAPAIPDTDRTWSDYAGYSTVRVRTNSAATATQQPTSEYLYYRGLDGDRATPTGGTKSVTVTASDGSVSTDSLWLAGHVREQIGYNGFGGPIVTKTITTPWALASASDGTTSAYLVGDADVVTRTTVSAGGYRVSEVKTEFDTAGRAVAVDDLGDTATAGDDVCTRTDYAGASGDYLKSFPAEVRILGAACTAAPTLPADAISDTRLFYDGSSTLAAAPTDGDVTRTDAVVAYTGATPSWQTQSTATYDAMGRLRTQTDPRISPARTTTTAYTPADTGPLTSVAVTNPLSWTTTTSLNPAWGEPTATIDANNHRTDISYDTLGRRSQIWLPERPKSANPSSPSIAYAYQVNQSTASWTSTTTLTPFSSITDYTLYDGLLRPRQTQSPAEGGGRVITDTYYDSAGRINGGTDTYYDTANPSSTQITPTLAVPVTYANTYDGAGRPAADIRYASGTELWRTSYTHGGDYDATTPPDGSTPTTTYTDARGHTTRLLQHHGATTATAADETDYGYDHRGQLSAMSTSGPTALSPRIGWAWTYDVLGREKTATDPDSGTTTTAYDAAGRIATRTDSRGTTLAYAYDGLDRQTGLFSTSLAGTKLAGYTYDTLAKGQRTSATRYVGADSYTSAVTGYDVADRPTGQNQTIPASAGTLAGTYSTALSYTQDGQLLTATRPAVGGLPAETLGYDYDALGNSGGVSSAAGGYVVATGYTNLNQLSTYAQLQGNTHTETTLTWDAATRRVHEKMTRRVVATDAVVADHHYTYTDSGRLESDTDDAPGGGLDRQCYDYDYLQRLTDVWTPTASCAGAPSTALGGPAPYWDHYTYDLTGNRTTATMTTPTTTRTDTYTYPAAGQPQPHAVATIAHTVNGAGTGTDSYDYDPAGNTTTRPGSTLTHDPENRLTGVTASTQTQGRVYDADGALLLVKGTAENVLYLGDTELHAPAGGGALRGVRTYTAFGQPVAERTATAGGSSQLYFLADDPHGTTVASIAISTGSPVTRRYLDPFGNARGTPLTWIDTHDLLNAPTDPTTSLTHLGARDYDPALGRFTTVDPVLDPTDPQQNNGYAYAWNNPTNHADPSGMDPDNQGPCASGGCHSDGSTGGGGAGGEHRGPGSTPPAPGNSDDPWSTNRQVAYDYVHGTHCTGLSYGTCRATQANDKFATNQLSLWTGLQTSMEKASDPCHDAVVCDSVVLLGKVTGVSGCRDGDALDCAGLLPLGKLPKAAELLSARHLEAAWGAGKYKHGGFMTTFEHINYRHDFDTGFPGVSRFSKGTSVRQIKGYVDEALRRGDITANGSSGYVVAYDSSRVIGIDPNGSAATGLTVIIRDGVIRTAYPTKVG